MLADQNYKASHLGKNYCNPQVHNCNQTQPSATETYYACDIALDQTLDEELGFELFDEAQQRLKGKAIHQSPVLVNHRPAGIFQD